MALADRPDISQTEIAKALGVHRSVINRQFRGTQDMTIGRVAELAWALGYEPEFNLLDTRVSDNKNTQSTGLQNFKVSVAGSGSIAIIMPKSNTISTG